MAPWGLPLLAQRTGTATLQAMWVRITVGVLTVGVVAVSLVQVVRIGDSGAKAAWKGLVCAQEYVNGACPGNVFLT